MNLSIFWWLSSLTWYFIFTDQVFNLCYHVAYNLVNPQSLNHDHGEELAFSTPYLTSASETTSTSNTLLELLDLNNIGCVDALKDQLSNAVTLLDLKVGLVVVEEKNLDLATVIGIDNTSASVNEVLGSET
jgi:hypothetical protein